MSPVPWDLGGTRSLILESLHAGTYVQASEAVQDATAPQEPKQVIRGDFPVTFSNPPTWGCPQGLGAIHIRAQEPPGRRGRWHNLQVTST